ncbi:MAG: radical SAM protein [Candidatus Thermoplasmatota archaeon]
MKQKIVFWEMTRRCNLKCKHCRMESNYCKDDELSGNKAKEFISSLKEISPLLILTGGEPLLRDDLFEILGYIKECDIKCALATNGTLLNEEIAMRIAGAQISRVSISIDSADKRKHDRFRGLDGAFESALNGIANLRKFGVSIQINMSVSKENRNEIEDVLLLAKNVGAIAFHIFMLVPVGSCMNFNNLISGEEYEKILLWLLNKSGEIELRATCTPHYNRVAIQNGKKPVGRGCLAGKDICFVSYNGFVQPCGYLPVFAGNVKEMKLKDIWNNSKVFEELRKRELKGKCGLCEYKKFCGGCRARAYAITGDYLEEEKSCIYEP